MIVDDDEDDRDFFCEAVKEINIETECIVAINGEDALHILKNGLLDLPDYIFLDLNMPRMNGINCLTELKKDVQLKDIPVVIYSTTSYEKETNEVLHLGAFAFIVKPTSLQKLMQEILYIIHNPGPFEKRV